MITAAELDKWFQENETFGHHLGIHCRKTDIGYCEVEAVVGAYHLNPSRTAHGGFVFSLIDMVAGIAGGATLEGHRRLVTQSASIYYLRPAQMGEKLRAVGKLVHCGHATGIVFAKVYNEKEDVVARGEVSVFYLGDTVTDVKDFGRGFGMSHGQGAPLTGVEPEKPENLSDPNDMPGLPYA